MASQEINCHFTLTCVRHGETDANLVGLVQGQGVDSPINERGKCQSTLLGKKLCNEKFDVVLSSDLKRTRQTCEIILHNNRLTKKSIVFDKMLRERTFGVMEGRYYHELKNFVFPSSHAEEGELPEGAESLRDVEERAMEFFKNLYSKIMNLERTDTVNVLIVSHGGFLACLFNCFDRKYECKFPPGVNPGHISENTCTSKFDVTVKYQSPSEACEKITLKCLFLNDRSHMIPQCSA